MLDTTMATEATPIKGFRKGIQNVYIVLASDEKNARVQVLLTFRPNRALMDAFMPHTHVIALETVTGLLTPRQALWSYIPMGGSGAKAPGQQKRIPTPESLLDPKSIVPPGQDYRNLKPMEGTIPMASPYIPKQPAQPLGAVTSAVPIPRPIVYDEQIKRDEAYAKTESVDPLMSLLGDPAQMARLQALLGALNGGKVPENLTLPKKVVEDPIEASMRFTDEGSYDDSLTAIPSGPASLPQGNVPDNIPGLVQPDNAAMARIRGNIQKVRLEDIQDQ